MPKAPEATTYSFKMAASVLVSISLCSCLFSTAQGYTGFVNTEASKKYALWSILDKQANSTMVQTIGTVQKHSSNPLLIQDKPWEARLDNGYPNVVKTDIGSSSGYQLWYGGFIACKKCSTSEGRDRVNGWHYANSTDGITWNKPALGIYDLGK